MAVESPIIWRHLLRPAFEFAFERSKRSLLVGIIPAHNLRSASFAQAVGFELAHIVRDGWAPGDDMLVFEMRKEQCRWLEPSQCKDSFLEAL